MKLLLTCAVVLCFVHLAVAQAGAQTSDALIAKLDTPDRVMDIAFSPDGSLLAAGFGWNEGGVRVWNVADRTVAATLKTGDSEKSNVQCVAFSPDGKWLAAANWDGDVLLWPVGKWGSPKTVLKGRGKPESLAFSPTGTRLAFVSEEKAILYDLTSKKVTTLGVQKNKDDSLISLSFSPDGSSATLFRDNAIEFVDTESGQLIKSWGPSRVEFFGRSSLDGRYVIAGGGAVYGEKAVEVWSTQENKKVGELTDFRSGLFALAVANSGKLFALAGGDYGNGGDLSLWDLQGLREIGFVSFGEFPMQGLAFSPDDTLLAAGSEDGVVLLYAVERIRGPQLKKQASTLCGEIMIEGGRTFVVPLSKVPRPMSRGFEYPWKLEVSNTEAVAAAAGLPVELRDWAIESSASTDRARVAELRTLRPRVRADGAGDGHIVYGDVQNPGWDEGFVAKLYGDGSFVATNNSGKCLANGHLSQLKTDYESVRNRLLGAGLLAVPKEPLTLGADHYRTRFIALATGGEPELRSDADSFEVLLKGGPARKREAFTRVYEPEEPFVNSLISAGMKPVN